MSNRICLVAIFRNEARNVQRCLDAARPFVDFVSICDTGSTDDTPALISDWGEHWGIPTCVHQEAFVNFGFNRTRSVELAKQSFPEATHFLLLDADMVLMGNVDLRTADLTEPSYSLRQANTFIEYWNPRILRSDRAWSCRGVTHEYWESNPASFPVKFAGLWIDDREDGGHKADKFTRDLALLTAGLAEPDLEPGLRARYTFYMAQTLRDLGRIEEARVAYQQRVDLGGWPEEVFISLLERARLGIMVNAPFETIVAEHLQAFAARPIRAEALMQLARYCRESTRYAEGYLFAKMGLTIPKPETDILFVSTPAYEWQLLDEFAVCAYWIGAYRESADACDQLLTGGRLPSSELQRVKTNRRFAIDKLAAL